MSELPGQISSLSVDEKCELLDALWQDIGRSAPNLSEEQAAELDRRLDMYRQHPSIAVPWKQVKAYFSKGN